MVTAPKTDLDQRFSSEGAKPIPWSEAGQQLDAADVFWLSTVRPDGRPHVTTLIAVWLNGALYFCTGPGEQKAKNLNQNAACVLTTGCNRGDGLDVVVEGEAKRVTDDSQLRILADKWQSRHGWHFEVREGAFFGEGREAYVFEVVPKVAFGFGKGDQFSQTRWRFSSSSPQ